MNEYVNIELDKDEKEDVDDSTPLLTLSEISEDAVKDTTFLIPYDYTHAFYLLDDSKSNWPEFLRYDEKFVDEKVHEIEKKILEYHQPIKTALRRKSFFFLSIPEWMLLISIFTCTLFFNDIVGIIFCLYYKGYCPDHHMYLIQTSIYTIITILLWSSIYFIFKDAKVSFSQEVKNRLESALSAEGVYPRSIKTKKMNAHYSINFMKDSYNLELHLVSERNPKRSPEIKKQDKHES